MVRFIGSRLRLGFGRFASVYDTARSRESAATPLTGFGSGTHNDFDKIIGRFISGA